ncbi:MAG TPA: type II toxin-antitoxin system HicB family antitoxin [Acidimicrobiales bacterium]|jgi:predicted RNase H-like HicB family nuclease
MKVYVVKAERSGGWWALEVPEIPGVFSQARRLDQAEGMARDAIATMLDIAPDSFEVEVVPILGLEATMALDALAQAKDELARAQQQATVATAAAVSALAARDHLTMRDAGKVLGVSHQRVAQLLYTARGQWLPDKKQYRVIVSGVPRFDRQWPAPTEAMVRAELAQLLDRSEDSFAVLLQLDFVNEKSWAGNPTRWSSQAS